MIPTTLPTEPQPIAPDTWLIPTLAAEPSGAFIAAHNAVIRGAEPIIIDTGCALVRDAWLRQVFAVVEPEDVRWIFLSHDDHDHLGNLDAVLERCPNATLLASFAIASRLGGDIDLPFERMRWLDTPGTIDIGDRVLTTVRPPLFDSPATRGLHDSVTGLFWAVDSFGSLLPGAVYEARDVPAELYAPSFAALNSWNTPWLEWVDPAHFAAHLAASRSLPIELVASAHGPVLRGTQIDDAYRRTLALAGRPPVAQPGPELLDALLASVNLSDVA
jgi:flavorubredoxin